MKVILKRIVNWLMKPFTSRMNPKLSTSNNSYQSLKAQVNHRVNEIHQFLTVDNPTLPSGQMYSQMVENFERITPDSFKYSIHGRMFLVETIYHPKANGVAELITYETKYDKKSYPNLELHLTSNIKTYIDGFGNATVNDITVQGNLGLTYFDAVGYFMYP